MKFLLYAEKLREATGGGVCINVEYWAHRTGDTAAHVRLSFIPGLDGTECSAEEFTSVKVFQARVAEIINKYAKEAA